MSVYIIMQSVCVVVMLFRIFRIFLLNYNFYTKWGSIELWTEFKVLKNRSLSPNAMKWKFHVLICPWIIRKSQSHSKFLLCIDFQIIGARLFQLKRKTRRMKLRVNREDIGRTQRQSHSLSHPWYSARVIGWSCTKRFYFMAQHWQWFSGQE